MTGLIIGEVSFSWGKLIKLFGNILVCSLDCLLLAGCTGCATLPHHEFFPFGFETSLS